MLANSVTPVSLLDTDLYKLTMQQAVLQKFPDAHVTYRFANRSLSMLFSRECIDAFKDAVSRLPTLSLSPSERMWLQSKCPYFTLDYLSFLSQYRFNLDQLTIVFKPSDEDPKYGLLDLSIEGLWVDTILWEVPLMSLLSEAYFKMVDRDWSYDRQEEHAYQKGLSLLESGISFTEYGTRRRRSLHTQDLVIRGLTRASEECKTRGEGKLLGTSNVYLACKYDIKPAGTIAHEWFMAIGASFGYEHANTKALDMWYDVYGSNLLVALTDTFTTEVFFKDFSLSPDRARIWTGIRQDSGDPFIYAPRAKEMYESQGIDPREKVIIYSDGLNPELAKNLKKQCDEIGMKRKYILTTSFSALFGIGTNFTNDFKTQSSGGKEKSKPLNIVIKIASIDGKPCVKLSDEATKNTGDPESVRQVKKALGVVF